jgi:hypothetical protein
MQHFNELDECDWHNLLQDLLIEYVTLLTNPDSTTLSTPSHKKQERSSATYPVKMPAPHPPAPHPPPPLAKAAAAVREAATAEAKATATATATAT